MISKLFIIPSWKSIEQGNGINFSIFNFISSKKNFFQKFILNFSLFRNDSNLKKNYTRISKIIILEIVVDPFSLVDETIFQEEIWKISSVSSIYAFVSKNYDRKHPGMEPLHSIGHLIVRLVKTALRHNVAMKWFGANDSTRASGTIRDGYIPLDWRLILNSPISRRSLINPFRTRDGAWLHLDTILTRSQSLHASL